MKLATVHCHILVAIFVISPTALVAGTIAGPISNPTTGHTYYLLTENLWTASEQEAVSLGGHLVTINDQQEQDWVWSTFGSFGGVRRSLWIGLNDVATENEFVWASGEQVTYSNWLDGQPDNNTPEGEDYVHMIGNDRNGELETRFYGKWNDYQDSDVNYASDNFGPLHGVVEVAPTVVSVVSAADKHFLWQIDRADSRAYILGSIHVLRAIDLPLPSLFENVFSQSSKVYFEIDIDEAVSAPVQEYIQSKGTYPSGQNLQSKLPSATYTKIRTFADNHGLPLDYFKPYRPWYVSAVVGSLAYRDMGALSENGVDQHFFDLAKAQGKARGYLETSVQQIDYFAEAPESEWLNGLIQQMENPVGGTIELIENWKHGNAEALVATNLAMATQAPGIYSALITTRNQNWIGTVTNELARSKTNMFIVGAAHTVGSDGLPAQLEALGYSVRQLPLMPARLLALRAIREIPNIQTNQFDLPATENGGSVVDLPVLLHSRVRLVATIESAPNVTNVWFRDGLAIPGQSGSELDVGFPAGESQPVYHLMVADPNGQRVYSGVRLQPIEPHSPSLRVAQFTESGGFQSFVSVWESRLYQVDVTEGLEAGNSWRWFSNLVPTSSIELPLATLPWSKSVPKRFYRVMEVY